MELINQNREYIKGAIEMCLWYEKTGVSTNYPSESFTFNVFKQGTNWEVQFIYVVDEYEIEGGDVGEWMVQQKTTDLKFELPDDCTIQQLSELVQGALEEIVTNEYVR